MCQFCAEHGEGKKWYLEARNYGLDLASDLRRREFIRHFFGEGLSEWPEQLAQLQRLSAAPPWLRRLVSAIVTRRMKRDHFGQVVPIEDVESILQIVNSVVRLPCVCRRVTVGRDVRYCFGVTIDPEGALFDTVLDSSYDGGIHAESLERIDASEAMDQIRGFEDQGLMHSIWTFKTPFIAGICNCDRSGCMAMISTVSHDVKVMFRAEYVVEIDPERCTGCRACLRLCQFGALSYSAANRKAVVDLQACYGCGVCRAACKQDAIRLRPREEVPEVARVW
jgi:NAD-dependent dihydropyrimidine dehydrogenase PreA subunit